MSTYIAEDYEVLEPGVYQAVFDRIEESDEPGQYGYWIDWFFMVMTEHGPIEVMGRSSKPERFTRATKARQWAEALNGRELTKGESFDPGKLTGTPVTLTIDVVKTEKGDERNRIIAIRRVKAASTSPVQQTPDQDYEAWLAQREEAKHPVPASNAQEPPPPSEPPSDLDSVAEA